MKYLIIIFTCLCYLGSISCKNDTTVTPKNTHVFSASYTMFDSTSDTTRIDTAGYHTTSAHYSYSGFRSIMLDSIKNVLIYDRDTFSQSGIAGTYFGPYVFGDVTLIRPTYDSLYISYPWHMGHYFQGTLELKGYRMH